GGRAVAEIEAQLELGRLHGLERARRAGLADEERIGGDFQAPGEIELVADGEGGVEDALEQRAQGVRRADQDRLAHRELPLPEERREAEALEPVATAERGDQAGALEPGAGQ